MIKTCGVAMIDNSALDERTKAHAQRLENIECKNEKQEEDITKLTVAIAGLTVSTKNLNRAAWIIIGALFVGVIDRVFDVTQFLPF